MMSDIVEAFATVSDQGDKGTCSCHALGKSVVDGFQRGIFVPGRAVTLTKRRLFMFFSMNTR